MIRMLIPIALLLLLGALQTGVSQAGSYDLSVEEVRLRPGYPSPVCHSETGMRTEVEVRVRNQGATISGYQVQIEWARSINSSYRPLGDSLSSVDVYYEPFPSGAHFDHRFVWNVGCGADGQTGHIFLRATVRISNVQDSRPQNDQKVASLFVPQHKLSWFVANPAFELQMGETGFFRISVHNAGNVPEPVRLGLVNPDEGLRNQLTESLTPAALTIGPGQTRHAHLFIGHHSDAGLTDDSTAYEVEIQSDFAKPSRFTTPSVRLTRENIHGTFHGSLERLNDVPLLEPASEHTVEFRLRNLGNQSNAYRLVTLAPEQWTWAISSEPIPLLPSEQHTLRTILHVPHDAEPGGLQDLVLEARSERGSQVLQVPVRVEVRGPRPHIPVLRVQDETVYTGEPWRLTLALSNVGSEPAPDNGTLIITTRQSTEVVETQRLTHEVGSRSSRTESLLMAPLTRPGAATVEARWRLPGGSTEGAASVTFEVRQATVQWDLPLPVTGQPGETLHYLLPPHAFRIRNGAPHTQELMVSVRASNGTASLDRDSHLRLSVGEEVTVPIRHVLPRFAPAHMEDELCVRAFVQGRPDINWTRCVTSKIIDRRAPQLQWAEQPPSEHALGSLPLTVGVIEDSPLDRVEVRLTTPHGLTSSLPLEHQEGERWSREIQLWTPGNHTLAVRARDAAGNEAEPLQFVIRAVPIAGPRLEWRTPPEGQTVRPGSVAALLVEDVRPVTVVVRGHGPSGQVRSLAHTLDRSELSFALDPAPGDNNTLTVTVAARNSAGAETKVSRTFVFQHPTAESMPDDDPGVEFDNPAPDPAITVRPIPAFQILPGIIIVWAVGVGARKGR